MTPRNQRGQSGVTLIELLLVLTVSGLIAIPTLSWIFLGLQSEEANQTRSAEATASNVLTFHLLRDLAASTAVTAGGTDCAGGTHDGGTVVLSIETDSTSPTVVYAVVSDAGSGARLARRSCATAGGAVDGETRIAGRLTMPAAGWASIVTCADRPGRTADPCGQVTVELPFESGRVLSVRGTRRVGGPR